jgi:hypothetical protein
VPSTNGGWSSNPFEAQYLKLYDVTPPPVPTMPTSPFAYVVGTNATFSWTAVSDPDGGVSGYHVVIGTTPGGSNVFNGVVAGTSKIGSGNYGQTLYARVSAVNNAGIEGAFGGISSGVLLLDPSVDSDGDGMSNGDEAIAGMNPLDANSSLRILSFSTGNVLTWSSVSGRTYQVQATANLLTNFTPLSGIVTSLAPTATYLDLSATNAQQFYRVRVLP